MLEHGSCKLFKISETKAEYKSFRRTLTGENKMADIEPEMINKTLMESMGKKVQAHDEIYLIHDPSDIRKPHSEQLENLGHVRALNGDIISGYSTYNVVAVMPGDKSVHLLSHRSYSNKEPSFLKAEYIKKIEDEKSFDGEREARELYASDDYFNKKILAKEELERVSTGLKESKKDLKLTHILDREFDDNDYFELISKELKDDFVARIKKSRSLESKGDDGKKIKLIDSVFKNTHEATIQKFQFKNKSYQDATILVEWTDYNGNSAVRVTISDRQKRKIFKVPMLLLTNKSIASGIDAYGIYLTYLKRAKIEYVFRFLKDGLGWEEIQIRDFKGIQNLLSLCFYVSSYLYEIGEEVAYDDFAILLAEMGGGKDKVTRHYILEGIKNLLSKYRIDRIFKERNISKKTQEALSRAAGADLVIE